jgi:hypothetical protein
MGANSNWQLAIRLCISSLESVQQSALSQNFDRNGRKGRKEDRNANPFSWRP